MTMTRAGSTLALLLAWAWCFPAPAQEAPAEAPRPVTYSPKGADTCLKCHDDPHVAEIFKTPHGTRADSRTPFAQLQCESCHGPGGEHARKKKLDEPQGPIVTFGLHAKTPPAEQNKMCLACHADSKRVHWSGSAHEGADVPCAACHALHSQDDPVRAKATQMDVCGSCHARERAQSLNASAHPLRQGGMDCTDCHSPHGSVNDAMLVQPTVNETCYTCHADKRGPFLWEHAPVSEDCTLCHQPHGSPHRSMLVQQTPLLCQNCHSQSGHPSLALTPNGLPNASPNSFLLVNGCANCHSAVHGSNHPSGADLGR